MLTIIEHLAVLTIFFPNIPNKVTDTQTITNPNCDHSYMISTYTSNEQKYTPKFIYIRENHKLTRHNLKTYWDLNDIKKHYTHTGP